LAVRLTWQVAEAVKIPLMGMGGIETARDALEFMLAGASAVQVGTANFIHPDATVRVVRGLEAYLSDNGIPTIRELIGALRTEVEV
jgi:dihydroorotate dehydrogenase (NAD+) catalytic subunit